MHKPTIILQSLLSISLLVSISSTHARESVSSYEQSLSNETSPAGQIQSDSELMGIPANYDMEALQKALKERGWSVKNQNDGSLILVPQKSSEKPSKAQSTQSTKWQQLKQEFQNAGWSAELDADGAMILTPSKSIPAASPETSTQTVESSEELSFESMQQKLKEKGWGVSNNPDGSIMLYPPKTAPQKKTVAQQISPCPGIKPAVNVSLPVDSWQEAHDIAQGWLSSESIPGSSVGKIRKIINVYIISIVSDAAPFALMHQIAVRTSNGAIIILN